MVSLYLRLHSRYNWKWRFRLWLRSYSDLEGTVPARSLYDQKGKILVDYVARFENLSSDFETICRNTGSEPISLPKANTSHKTNYIDYYDQDSRRHVEELFAEDIERYKYRFGE